MVRLQAHSDPMSQYCRGRIAVIHLCRDSVQLIVPKPDVENSPNGFGGVPLTTIIWIEYPANLCLAMLTVGQPQCDIADWLAVVLDDQGKGAARGPESGSCDPFGQFLRCTFARPRVVE